MYPTLITSGLILVFGSSAYMSISGLVSIFSNNPVIIISMGLGMEIGKVLTISHLYRTWQKNNILARTVYILIILVLTILTSFEVMGFLSQCHQKATEKNHIVQSQIQALNEEENVLRSQITTIDNTLKGLPETYVTKRIQEREKAGYEKKQTRLIEIVKQKNQLQTKLVSINRTKNPVSAIANTFEMDESIIISIFIPFIVLILEPLSIGLAIATNAAWLNRNGDEDEGTKSYPTASYAASQAKPKDNSNLTDKLKRLQKEYDLSISQIAQITGRKKLKTCEGWLKGSLPTPPRALAEIEAWVEREYAKDKGS